MPAATAWFANIDNPNTRRAYRNDLGEFMTFIGISSPEELRLVVSAHLLAWRKDLERRELAGDTIRRKLAALSSLFEYLSDANAVTHNPVKGVRRPKVESYEGKTRNNRAGELPRMLSDDGIYKLVRGYTKKLGLVIGAQALRATAAINALEHESNRGMPSPRFLHR